MEPVSNQQSGNAEMGHRLGGAELDAFLRRGLVSHLSCCDADGWPYVVPLWHAWDGDGFWVIAAKEAAWARFLAADPRVALSIDETETLRRVLCQGTALLAERPSARGRWNAIALDMAARYLGSGAVAAYQSRTAGLERWLIRIEPHRLVGWEGPGRSDGQPVEAVPE
jgi:hypothetical protein